MYCFNSTEEGAEFWKYTPVAGINETISGKFNEQDLNELYSKADLTEKKFKDFTAHCQNGSVGPYLKYLGTTSTIRDLVSLGDAILGEGEPINYWGVSYGTVIGFNFINSKFSDLLTMQSDLHLVPVFPEVCSILIEHQTSC